MPLIIQEGRAATNPFITGSDGNLTYREAVERAGQAGYTAIHTLAGPVPLERWLPLAEPAARSFWFDRCRAAIRDLSAKPGSHSSVFHLSR